MLSRIFTPVKGPMNVLCVLGAIAFFVLFFALLDRLPGRQKRNLTMLVTFLAGLFYFLEFMIPPGWFIPNPKPGTMDNALSLAVSPLSDFFLVVGAMALGLGILNLVQINGRVLLRLQPGWHNAAIFFFGFLGMIDAGLWHASLPNSPFWNLWYGFFFNTLYINLSSTVFALLAFFIASAAFRAFRMNSVEATLMMVTAFIVMLGNVGSEVVTGWIPPAGHFAFLRLDNITYWIMTTVNMSAQRALLFGIAMGELAIALRVWLSLERGHFFDQEV